MRRICEHQVHDVARVAFEACVIAENRRGGAVPGQNVPPTADHVGRLPAKRGEHAPYRRIDNFRTRLAFERRRPVRQYEQVAPLGGVEAQGGRQRAEDLGRRADPAPLFQPSVPSDADPGELRDLLAAQAGSPAPEAVRQADLGGCEPLAARTKERRKCAPPLIVRTRRSVHAQ